MFKDFEIKLNNIQSIILVVSIFTIGILSFALGFLIGKDSPSEVVALKTEQPKTTASLERKDSDAIRLPLPQVEEEQETKTDEATQKVTDNRSVKSETRPTTASLQSSYTVQVGSFKTMNEASNFKSKIDKKGYQTYITTYDTSDGKWFRVRIGQFKTKDEAESLTKKLKSEENLASFITNYK